MIKSLALAATAALALVATPVLACPDWTATPNAGEAGLAAGFMPDPHMVNVIAGGTEDLAACFGSGFVGYVSVAPDFDLYWSGNSARLTIAVESSVDTVLLINDPSGNWVFNDDYRGLDAGIVINNPAEGLYDIWVCTYSAGSAAPARLLITEFDY